MSERTEKAERVLQIELHPDYTKTFVEIVNLYQATLMEIAKQEISSAGSITMQKLAADALVKGFQTAQTVRGKIAKN